MSIFKIATKTRCELNSKKLPHILIVFYWHSINIFYKYF